MANTSNSKKDNGVQQDPVAKGNRASNTASGDSSEDKKGKGKDGTPGSNKNAGKQDANKEGFGEDE